LQQERSYTLLSDYAVYLLKLEKYKEGLDILVALHHYYPTEYKIAANLGTAYELNGDVENALLFIQLGMQLNPEAHDGSEWVHVRVLQTKLLLKKNADYLKDHTVLSLTEAQEQDSLIRQQINIQVRERFPFSPGPDPIMASLLIDLADCYANTQSIEFAKAVYEIAKKYYGDPSPMLDDKIKSMQKLINKYLNVRPNRDSDLEGMNVKIGSIQYKTLLENHQLEKYTIPWEKINTNADSLISLVDLTAAKARLDSLKRTQPDTTIEKRGVAPVTTISGGEMDWLYSILFTVFILAGLYFLLMKFRAKNR
jgi:tetratricopeptide (TPR) repeat protein